MDFKQQTPNSKIMGKVLGGVSSSSPFSSFPKYSTPPSRFTKIMNPFTNHLLEKLHLPILSNSPSVFTPLETEEKFKWNIDEISTFKPADIDEATLDQHVDDDPHLETIVQEKINRFFSEKHIVPSPLNLQVKTLLPQGNPKRFSDGSCQTDLSLPPELPQHVEDVLRPYFSQSKNDLDADSSLHRRLFDSPQRCSESSRDSIPDSPYVLSPIQFATAPLMEQHNSSMNFPEDIEECRLSPIKKSPKHSKSACRLSFSQEMSVDASLLVPDINNLSDAKEPKGSSGNNSANWDLEYKRVELLSPQLMDVSTTPHSKQFSGQRKRLSDSFKENEEAEEIRRVVKKQSVWQDTGYLTGCSSSNADDWDMQVFASTPSKKKVAGFII